MPKFIRDSELREMQKDPRTGIYFARKSLKGKKPLLKSTGTKDRTKARKKVLELLAQYMANQPIVTENPTFREIADKVFALKANKAKATQDIAHNRLFKHLCPYFGHMRVKNISENTWDQYIIDTQTTEGRTFADDAKLMMAVMKYAFNERMIDRKVRIRNPDPPNQEGRVYSDEEIFKLYMAASTDDMKLQILIGYTMGMRHGEIAGLMWEWIDLEKNVINLPAEITKTRRGRVVSINSDVGNELRHRSALCVTGQSVYVFPSKDHTKPIPDFDSQWQRTWARAKIDGRFHFLRHTCISNMAAAGIPESTIRKIVGCSERTMRKVYLHLKDDLAFRAVNLEGNKK